MTKAVNAAMISGLTQELSDVDSCVLVGCNGLTVAEASELRDTLREQDFRMRVVKNTLAKKSFDDAGLTGLGELLDGPSAVVFGGEGAIAISKVIVEESKKRKKKLTIHGGFSEGEVIDADGVDKLSKIPGKKELLSMIMSGLFGPVSGLAKNMDDLLTEIQGLIDALAEKNKEG